MDQRSDELNEANDDEDSRVYVHSNAATPSESPSLKATLSPTMYVTEGLHSLERASMAVEQTVGTRRRKQRFYTRRWSGSRAVHGLSSSPIYVPAEDP